MSDKDRVRDVETGLPDIVDPVERMSARDKISRCRRSASTAFFVGSWSPSECCTSDTSLGSEVAGAECCSEDQI
jgi:hypothetical protein